MVRPLVKGSLEKVAAACWLLAVLTVCVRVAIAPHAHNSYEIFATAGQNWLMGQEIYRLEAYPFRYSPVIAALFAPFSILPLRAGSVIWRLLNTAALAGGFFWFTATALPRPLGKSHRALLFLLLLPLSISNLSNGQSNPLILGLLLAALAAAISERWSLAAGFCAGASLSKIYPISTGLLLVVCYPRRFGVRFAAAIVAGLLTPFLLQWPAYVAVQYSAWVSYLLRDDRWNFPIALGYHDLRLLLRIFHLPMSRDGYIALQLFAALIFASLCFALRNAQPDRSRLMVTVLGLSTCWMVLLGPATEASTFVLIAPTIAIALVEARLDRHRPWVFALLVLIYALMIAGPMLNLVHAPLPFPSFALKPLGALLLTGFLLATAARPALKAGPRIGAAHAVNQE